MPEETGLVFNNEFPLIPQQPNDVIPPDDRGDVTNLDEDHLRSYLYSCFMNDVDDRDDYGWIEKREYDAKAYYGIKNKALMEWPYKGASAFPVPMTPTLVDTAWANIKAGVIGNDGNVVKVNPTSAEDFRTAPILEEYMNWKLNNEINIEPVLDLTAFRTFYNGVTFIKVIKDLENNILMSGIDCNNVYLPIDAKGMQKDQTDRITHIVPLSYNDLQFRKRVYKDIDMIQPGLGIGLNNHESVRSLSDIATGTSLLEKHRRETYFIAETYLSYVPPGAYKPIELIVWWSPNGLGIHRVRVNKEGFRPFADFHAYKHPDRFWSMSLPEKIRNVQEELDYSNKQNTDALDRAISPAMFIEDTNDFNMNQDQRIPGGIYKIGRNNKVFYEPQPPVERGFERKIVDLWYQAEKLTGLTDIAQGVSAARDRTLGQTELREARADIRFSTLLKRFSFGYKQAVNLVYEYANRYEDRKKKIRVLGFNDFKSLNELFPNSENSQGLGLGGKYDFDIGGKSSAEKAEEKQDMAIYYQQMVVNPLFQDPASLWKLSKLYSESQGRKDFDTLVSKPKEVDIYSPSEFIQRILSGQYDIVIRPGIDADNYLFEIELFMKTETFEYMEQQGKMTLMNAYRQAYMIAMAERQALVDANLILQKGQMDLQMQNKLQQQQVA